MAATATSTDAQRTLANLLREIDDNLDVAVALRRELRDDPELAHAEHRSAERVRAAIGPDAEPAAGTGVIARIGEAGSGQVAVRCELDALLVEDGAGDLVPRHVCGHDVHAAALVALTRAAMAMSTRLPARLLALFQPSEEAYPSGAEALVRDGVVGKETRAVVAVHVHPDIPWGEVALDPGPINASADTIEVVVRGEGSHAAYPHRGSDAILALAQVIVALHARLGRSVDPVAGGVLNVGVVAGGSAENVVAAQARARLTVRAQAPEDRQALRAMVAEVATATARAHGCEAELDLTPGEPALVNDRAIVAAARPLFATSALRAAPPWRSFGADDFSYFGEVAPTAMAFVGLRGAPSSELVPLHHPRFQPPDQAVRQVARAQAVLLVGAACAEGVGSPRAA